MTGRADVVQRNSALRSLAAEQQHAVSRAQLRALGVDDGRVAIHVAAGRWQTAGPLVVVLHTGPLAACARRWASVLTAGPCSALGAWSALEVWGLVGWERPLDHVVVPRGAAPPRLPWLRVHESRRHTGDDVRRRGGLAVHGVERAAVDAAAWSPTDRAGGGLLAAVVQQRLSTAGRLLAALDAAGRVRRRPLLRSVLHDVDGGSQSMAEVDVVRLCRRTGLPVPVRQACREDATGRRRYLDAEWLLPSGRRVLLEIDGAPHLEVGRWYDDALRLAEVGRPGETLLRLPAMAVRCDEARVVAVLRRHLLERSPDLSEPGGSQGG